MRSRGDGGEDLARRVLERACYFILMNNFCVRGGEIDIVARAPNGAIVFVEVKFRTREPEDHRSLVPRLKLMRMQRAARGFLVKHALRERIRFDLILLVPDVHGTKKAHVFWYKNIVG